ncbi:Cytosol non-specific dipeptidase [Enhygromyxa salina]|uniref:Cytosol non-specific dipeptidase n=1 Tax=Enhygromyxa salina TaxID=215803 RepID=A0A2S9YEQ8_9BACT|nr:beta-Ala-His dipeptidase [Enhygromyxa salina]PRQ03587.1 Cytosol non-specific dipeptidase [Enhygromyxa salina]
MGDELHPTLIGLEPAELWRQFDALRQIPRPSLHEAGVRAYLKGLAEREGWDSATDEAGNIVLRVPGRGAGVDSEPLAVQGHMDMVCEKRSDSPHDFHTDPIALRRSTRTFQGREREVLQAEGTTLGADNGIGVAAGLALALTPDLVHPPLELLFTADEEEGMSGAFGLDPGLLTARRLINLDAELEGCIYLSCAGGRELHAIWDLNRDERHHGDVPVRVSIQGLRGGHSGVDIHRGRANAIAVLVRLLTAEGVDLEGVRFASCDGGGRANAIARTVETTLWCAKARVHALERALETAGRQIAESMVEVDPELAVGFVELPAEDHDAVPGPVSARTSRAILEALRAQPTGVLTWSAVIPGLVETSNNLGTISTSGDQLRLVALARSSKDGAVDGFQDRCERTLEASGATVEYHHGFPGWEARVDTELLHQAEAAYEELFERKPVREAIHAGLECGVLGNRVPGLEMIAFGPDIFDAHTPDESLPIDTVEPFWRFVVHLAARLI